jgi:hypothetical protein
MSSGFGYGGFSPRLDHLTTPCGPDLNWQHLARPGRPGGNDKFQQLYGDAGAHQHVIAVAHLQVRTIQSYLVLWAT